MIRKLTKKQGAKYINDWCKGKSIDLDQGYFKEGSVWIAIDNLTNDCWVEEFSTKEKAIKYLKEGEF